jgi:hypothetical protein
MHCTNRNGRRNDLGPRVAAEEFDRKLSTRLERVRARRPHQLREILEPLELGELVDADEDEYELELDREPVAGAVERRRRRSPEPALD